MSADTIGKLGGTRILTQNSLTVTCSSYSRQAQAGSHQSGRLLREQTEAGQSSRFGTNTWFCCVPKATLDLRAGQTDSLS